MSSCSVIVFRNGRPTEELVCGNSWLGAMYIWTNLFDRYLKDPRREYDTVLSRFGTPGIDEFWNLWKREDLTMCERAVHLSTMDWFTVRRENFTLYAVHLIEFTQMYPGESHLLEWAEYIGARAGDADVDAVAFHHTSCARCLWLGPEREDGDHDPYDLRTMKHFEVYGELSKAGFTETPVK